MHHFFDAIQDTKGNALIGYFVRCVDATTGLAATLYADTSLTPIISVSGAANAAQVNSDGDVSFYITTGTYHLDIYATDSTTFVRRIQNIPMVEDVFARGVVTPLLYGAKGDGVTNDGAAFVAAIAALKAQNLNKPGYYGGSAKLFIPAGHYYLGTTTLDITHTLIIEGEGSGQFGPGAGGCTHLRWADATDGIRIQFPTTSGNTAIVATQDGAGGVVLRDLMLEGGFGGTTESEHHGIVIRSAIKGERLYIRNFPGEGVKAWAGTVSGTGYSGNVSTTYLEAVKVESCRGGFDIRGTDSNVVTLINCEPYLNRQYGILDDNGAGANTYIGIHAATNGQDTGPWPQPQCSYSGNRYWLKYGGDPTVAPSGTTVDTANWLYAQAGGAIANTIPAWVSTPGTFRFGGDYLTINSAGVLLDQCYSEGGGFSQFNNTTLLVHGAIGDTMYRGGHRITPQSGGLSIRTNNLYVDPPYGTIPTGGALAARGFTHTLGDNTAGGSNDFTLNLDATSASSKINFRTAGGTVIGYIDAENANGMYMNAPAANGWVVRVGGIGVANIDANGIGVASGSLGYRTGVGGAVTQATSRTTGVTLNKVCGQITLVSAAGSTSWQSFTLTNSAIAATDTVRVCQASGTDLYQIHVTNVAAGSCKISFATTGGTTTEQPVFNFSVIKGVTA